MSPEHVMGEHAGTSEGKDSPQMSLFNEGDHDQPRSRVARLMCPFCVRLTAANRAALELAAITFSVHSNAVIGAFAGVTSRLRQAWVGAIWTPSCPPLKIPISMRYPPPAVT
jgi:hypothetical protein